MSAFNDPCIPSDTIECRPFGSNVSDVDIDRVIFPFEGLNFTGCAEDLILSDFDGDGKVSNVEYQSYVAKTAARRCIFWPDLTLAQRTNFISLACQCTSQVFQGTAQPNCCVGVNAHLPTAGAANPATRTEPQEIFIQNVCVVTYGTLPGTNCSIQILPVLDPPPIIPIIPASRSGGTANGTRPLIPAIIGALLLLLLICCCCCILRRRRRKEYEEEEIIETEYPGKEEYLETPLQEQAARSMPEFPPDNPLGEQSAEPVDPMDDPSEYSGEGRNRGGGNEDDEDEDGEGRRRRGGNYVGEEEEDNQRRWGGGLLPPSDTNKDGINLRPIPPKDPAPDDPWDQPGRNIDEIKPDPDEMSAQEFVRYDPGGGVATDIKPGKDPVTINNNWKKGEKPEGDENDDRKHRIQAGMGEGEIWEKLDQDDQSKSTRGGAGGDAFDWVVQSAMNVMDTADEYGHLEGDDDSTQPPPSIT